MSYQNQNEEAAGPGFEKTAGPTNPMEEKLQTFNLYGFILYKQFDAETSTYMSERGGEISRATGSNCWITIFENPKNWGNNWKKQMQEIFGAEYQSYLDEWEKVDPSERNMSFKIAEELKIPATMFPCIIFLKSLKSKECSIPYPLINDESFYDNLFEIVSNASKDKNITFDELNSEIMRGLNRWYQIRAIKEKLKIVNEYTQPFLTFADPFVNMFIKLRPGGI